jgi:hypothetical protein
MTSLKIRLQEALILHWHLVDVAGSRIPKKLAKSKENSIV